MCIDVIVEGADVADKPYNDSCRSSKHETGRLSANSEGPQTEMSWLSFTWLTPNNHQVQK